MGIENRKNGCEIVLAIFPVDSCECSFCKDEEESTVEEGPGEGEESCGD